LLYPPTTSKIKFEALKEQSRNATIPAIIYSIFWEESSSKFSQNQKVLFSVGHYIIIATPSKTNLNDYEGPHVKTVCSRKNIL